MRKLALILLLIFGAISTAASVEAAGLFLLIARPALQIAGTPVTSGTLNIAMVPWTATATGGLTPYTFSDVNGALPSGVTVNSSTGVVGGTPIVNGTYPNVVIQVTDNAGNIASLAPYTLTIGSGGVATLTPRSDWTGGLNSIPPPNLPGGTTNPNLNTLPTPGYGGTCDIYTQLGSGFTECPVGNKQSIKPVGDQIDADRRYHEPCGVNSFAAIKCHDRKCHSSEKSNSYP